MPSPAPTSGSSTNLWDVVRAALVVAALVVLTLLVIKHYGQDAQKAATILGIAAPVLAAVVGGTLGYYAGNNVGQTTGEENVKKNLEQPVTAIAQQLPEQPRQEVVEALGELKGLKQ